MSGTWRQRGFTALEVLATLLVLSSAFVGAIALVLYGSRLASQAQSEATAWCTAATVAIDPQPLDGLDWSISGHVASGYLNGYYVKRIADPSVGTATSGIADRRITVGVFEVQGGREVARLVRYELCR